MARASTPAVIVAPSIAVTGCARPQAVAMTQMQRAAVIRPTAISVQGITALATMMAKTYKNTSHHKKTFCAILIFSPPEDLRSVFATPVS